MRVLRVLLPALAMVGFAVAPPAQNDGVTVRVVDIGAGLCTVTRAPDGSGGFRYMVYDAGTEFNFSSNDCFEAVEDFVDGDEIDILIVSHPDSDHVADTDAILAQFDVGTIVRTGFDGDSNQWDNFETAVGNESRATVIDLRNEPLVPGTKLPLGEATVTLVAGWNKWLAPESFETGEARNVISIVARLVFENKAVLYTGDSIGRRKTSINNNDCKNAEEFMVANSALVPLRSNVVIAANHGGNNGSSRCFVEAAFGTARTAYLRDLSFSLRDTSTAIRPKP